MRNQGNVNDDVIDDITEDNDYCEDEDWEDHKKA